jgi:hypothetical protein
MITIDIQDEECYDLIDDLMEALCKATTRERSDRLAKLRRAILNRKRD